MSVLVAHIRVTVRHIFVIIRNPVLFITPVEHVNLVHLTLTASMIAEQMVTVSIPSRAVAHQTSIASLVQLVCKEPAFILLPIFVQTTDNVLAIFALKTRLTPLLLSIVTLKATKIAIKTPSVFQEFVIFLTIHADF